MITHGKGIHSPVPARLKSYVFHWLEEFDLVLAYHTARPEHGGAGATYVMVRKSSEARRENREHFREKPGKS
jgi:DNA-nicking Smr family endonuclease